MLLGECHLESPAVDILIGGEHSNSLLLVKKKFFNKLCLEESRFGWVAEAPLDQSTVIDSRCCNLVLDVENTLTRFWEIEKVVLPDPVFSEYELCEKHFDSTHTRLPNCKFEIRLLMKRPVDFLADTYHQARVTML